MKKQDAIKYLKKKGKIEGKEVFNEEEQEEIKNVIKRGKIYGDPVAMVQ